MIGLDLSLRRPAAVIVPTPWKGDWRSVTASVPAIQRVQQGDEDGQAARLVALYGWALKMRLSHPSDIVWREREAFSQANMAHAKGEGLGVIRLAFWTPDAPGVRSCTASEARTLLLGSNPRERKLAKAVVMSAWKSLGFPWADDEDLCDAMTILNYGLSVAGGFFFAATRR